MESIVLGESRSRIPRLIKRASQSLDDDSAPPAPTYMFQSKPHSASRSGRVPMVTATSMDDTTADFQPMSASFRPPSGRSDRSDRPVSREEDSVSNTPLDDRIAQLRQENPRRPRSRGKSGRGTDSGHGTTPKDVPQFSSGQDAGSSLPSLNLAGFLVADDDFMSRDDWRYESDDNDSAPPSHVPSGIGTDSDFADTRDPSLLLAGGEDEDDRDGDLYDPNYDRPAGRGSGHADDDDDTVAMYDIGLPRELDTDTSQISPATLYDSHGGPLLVKFADIALTQAHERTGS